MNALAVLALDAEERRYAADLIEDDRRHRILRGAEDSAEQQVAAGRTVPAGFEGWAEENWQGDDYAAAFAAWLRATGRAADPSVEWAVSGPVDRVQQAGVRLGIARRALEAARSTHARAQTSMSREASSERGNGWTPRTSPLLALPGSTLRSPLSVLRRAR